MNIYELFGRQAEHFTQKCDPLERYHAQTQALLSRLKSGEVSIDSLVLTNEGWAIDANANPNPDND